MKENVNQEEENSEKNRNSVAGPPKIEFKRGTEIPSFDRSDVNAPLQDLQESLY